MNELTNKEIQDYLSGLSLSVLNAVNDKTWSKRTGEIALKYSLSEEQTNTLRNLVMFVMIGVENPDTFQKSIEEELGISNLLAEQLVKDIDERVFQYVVNLIQEKPSVKEPVAAPVVEKEKVFITTPNPKPVVNTEQPKKEIPKDEHTDFDVLRTMSKDIEYLKNNQDPVMHNVIDRQTKPNIEMPKASPVVEQKTAAAPANLPGVEIHQEITPEIKIDDLGDNKVFMGSEFMKQSTETKPVVQENTKPEPPKWGSNINDGSTSTNTPPKTENTQEKISVPRYTADPYREPLD